MPTFAGWRSAERRVRERAVAGRPDCAGCSEMTKLQNAGTSRRAVQRAEPEAMLCIVLISASS